jgi:predicted RecA/RadA family phage recombinase
VALTLADLTTARDALVKARAEGVRRYRDQNGEEVEYKSDAEMASALAALERRIAELDWGGLRPTPSSSERRKDSEMKNYVQRGENITVPAPAPATSGAVVVVGDLIGIASGDAAEGEPLDLVTVGVFELPKVAADAFPLGGAAFWRASDGLVTADDDEGDNPKLGSCRGGCRGLDGLCPRPAQRHVLSR